MLKIKDNVDLKELEKYGFVERYDPVTGKICMYVIYKYDPYFDPYSIKNNSIELYIKLDDRIINADYLLSINDISEVLYDLIKADLVEKVEK